MSKTKSGTKSLKKRDIWSKIGIFLKKPYENSQIYQVNRPNSVQKCCKKSGTKQRKIGTAVNFEPKIRTVPLKRDS